LTLENKVKQSLCVNGVISRIISLFIIVLGKACYFMMQALNYKIFV